MQSQNASLYCRGPNLGSCVLGGHRVGANREQPPLLRDGAGAEWEQKVRRGCDLIANPSYYLVAGAAMDFLLKSVRWIRALGRWLMKARRVWSPVLVAGGIVAVACLLPVRLEDRLRYGGLALELLGIATVILGIRGRRRLFNRPSLREHIRAW
jgi:hypothetical protein